MALLIVIVLIAMFMTSGGLLGLGIVEYFKKKEVKRELVDWSIPKEIWEKNKEDFRYYEKR